MLTALFSSSLLVSLSVFSLFSSLMAEEPQTGPSGIHRPPPTPPSSADSVKTQVSDVSLLQTPPSIPSSVFPLQNPEENDGPGIYAIPYLLYMGPMTEFPPNALVPLKYTIPTRPNPGRGVNQEHGQDARQQNGPQRQVVVRRFHFELQLDLALLLKLAAVVFLFSQDGSKQKLILLVLSAAVIYLYQTGALAPFIRWLQRAAAPPQPRAPVQPDPPVHLDDQQNPQPEEIAGAENENQNQLIENGELPANENQPEHQAHGFDWRAIVKEIQMVVVGFLTSLLPGFHNND